MTIVEFLTARLAEEEAEARAADVDSPSPWWTDGPGVQSGKWWVYATGEKFLSRETADHIAHHDPARVLREVEAKRAMLAEHGRREDCNGHPGPWMPHSDDYCVYDCWTCSQPWPCPTIKALVTVYADHPDYAALVSRI